MGNIEILSDQPPLFYVKGTGKLALDECKQQSSYYDQVFAKNERFVSVVDYRGAKLAPSLAVHRHLGQWSRENRDNMARLCPVSAILIKSALVKTLINPILKLMGLPNDVRMFNDAREARRWLEKGAKDHGVADTLNWPAG